jgi:outer membrane lipoprotein-sorting protein
MKKLLISFCALFVSTVLFAQNITTASAYFKTISEYYGTIKDYEVDFEIKIEKTESAGKLSFKAPNLVRMDYTNPPEQVICFNGDMLTIYIKEPAEAVLQQQVTPDNTNNAASLTTPQGLSLMSRYYTVAYETGQNPEPLEEGSDEMVVKLILTRKSASEAFRYIKLAVNNETKLIRRIEAVTPKGEEFVFNFFDYVLNQNLSEQRFVYDAPSSANNYNNFLFTE